MGSVYAVQLYEKMKEEVKDAEKEMESGNFESIVKWLDKKIHKQGRRYMAEELIEKVCGQGLNISIYLDYLNKKYKEIYNFK